MTINPRIHHQIPLARRETLSNCRQCKNYHGRRYGGTPLVCGIHPYGPGDESCDDFEKSDRPKWVVNIPSREFTSWGVTRFDLSCYNIETAVKVTCSVFATSEELAVHQVRKALCGDAEAKRGIQDLVVSYPPSGEPQFAAHWTAIDAMSEAQIMASACSSWV